MKRYSFIDIDEDVTELEVDKFLVQPIEGQVVQHDGKVFVVTEVIVDLDEQSVTVQCSEMEEFDGEFDPEDEIYN